MLEHIDLTKLIFGRLTWDVIPFHEPILLATFIAVAIGGLAVFGAITYFRLWGTLWRDWFTSIDHKKIGIMYVVLGLVMLLRGFADALMMRLQQALAFGGSDGFLPPHHYDQVFTAHGVIMIFFVAMPFVTGLMNFVVPLQIGARDVAFPFLNNFSFWMTTFGGILVMISLFVGEFARTGWLAYPPLSGILSSPDSGVDYYIWSLQIAGVGTLLSGINLIATIVKMRAPGMTMMKLPVFTWTALCTNVLIVAAFPVLTAVLAMLSLDRMVGTNFFTNDLGGNAMMYINLIWIWGHPEVYILVLPIFGVFSEVVSTFCSKRLFGYTSMVYASVVITILSYLVWLHHFFTMGSGASVNSFFGITTMIISIPTGAKMFNWLFTMYRGRIRFEPPMLWTIGFMVTFVIGGMTGVLLAVPPTDFVFHNSLFLIAHFHNVIIGGVVFGMFAGINYWFPKAFGYLLDSFGASARSGSGSSVFTCLHAAVCAGLDGRDAPPEPFRRPVAANLVPDRGCGRLLIACRHRLLPDPAGSQLPAPRSLARHHRRSVGWTHAGMVDFVAAAGLQFRLHTQGIRYRRLGRHETQRLRPADGRFQRHPYAEEHRRPDSSSPRSAAAGRFCVDLADVVAGRVLALPPVLAAVNHPHLQLQSRLPYPRRTKSSRTEGERTRLLWV